MYHLTIVTGKLDFFMPSSMLLMNDVILFSYFLGVRGHMQNHLVELQAESQDTYRIAYMQYYIYIVSTTVLYTSCIE